MQRFQVAMGFELLSNLDLARTHDQQWNERFSAYVIRSALAHADIAFGTYAAALRDYEFQSGLLHDRFGARPWSTEEEAEWKACYQRVADAEQTRLSRFLEPLWRAASALLATPAPNLVAAIFKVDLTEVGELDNDVFVDREPIDLILADIRRLTGDPSIGAGALTGLRAATQRAFAKAAAEA